MRPNPLDNIKMDVSQIETPFSIQQVETHLIFGPMAKYVPLGYVIIGGSLACLFAEFFTARKTAGEYIVSIFDKGMIVFVGLLFLRMSKRQQAVIAWGAVKFAMGFGAFLMAAIGAGTSFQRGYADAWPNLFLGLIWIPGIEFIPKITPHQRYVTIARIILSIPCIYFGIKSGNWHW